MEPLTAEERKLMEDNINIVYAVLNRYFTDMAHDPDIQQIAAIGFMKAIKVWDSKKGMLTTIAYKCITNQVLMHLRYRKKRDDYEYLDDHMIVYPDGKAISYIDIIPAPENITPSEEINIEKLQEILTPKEYIIVQTMIKTKSQVGTAIELGLNQSTISKSLKRIKVKLYRYFFQEVS